MRLKFLIIITLLSNAFFVHAQDEQQKSLEVYGFAMVDMGYNFKQINPKWSDALRINRLPKYKNEFAPDGTFFFGVRQTRFGVAGYTPTKVGNLKVVFEFDMFGVSADEGQTTMRLRYAYGQLGKFVAGQTTSPFMDSDVWPNTLEYWGPTGMVFYRNVQIRYMPVNSDKSELWIALERPGAGADKGTISIPEFSGLDSVKAQLSAPDVSAHFKKKGDWGSVQLAGILRPLKWNDTRVIKLGQDYSGSVTGWGAHLSTMINITKSTVFRGSLVYGEGIENYMQDAPNDVGTVVNGELLTAKRCLSREQWHGLIIIGVPAGGLLSAIRVLLSTIRQLQLVALLIKTASTLCLQLVLLHCPI